MLSIFSGSPSDHASDLKTSKKELRDEKQQTESNYFNGELNTYGMHAQVIRPYPNKLESSRNVWMIATRIL